MQDQITQLSTLEDELARASKKHETTLGHFDALEKGHERAFEILRDATSALDAKRKSVRRSKEALLAFQGYLDAQASLIARVVASKPATVQQFFTMVLSRVRHDVEQLVEAITAESRLDLRALAVGIDTIPAILDSNGALKIWRKSFDERTDFVEGQSEHLVNCVKVGEKTLNKALTQLMESVVTADSRDPGDESKGPDDEDEDSGWVPGHTTEAAVL